jgi:hypothetical protein
MRIAPAACRVALVLSALLPLVANAQEQETAPSGEAGEGGVFVHGLDGSVVSSAIANPPIDNMQPIRPSASGSDDFIVPYVDGSLELVGPAWIGGLRPFVSGSIGGQFSVAKDSAKEGTTGEFELGPGFPGSTTGTDELEALVRGQGSRLTTQFSPFFLTAGVGVAVPFETQEHVIRVKPSFRYLRDEVEAEGTVQRAVLLVSDAVQRPTGLDDFRLISLNASDTHTFNAIGPALEIDTDLSRKGRMVASVFVSGAAFFLLGDRGFEFRATDPSTGEYADFSVERNPVSFRFGIGVRLRFEP